MRRSRTWAGQIRTGRTHSDNLNSLLKDGAEEVESGLELRLGVVGLDDGRHHGDEKTSGDNIVSRRDLGDVDVCEQKH